MAINLANLKQKAIDAFKSAVKKAKETLINLAKSKIQEYKDLLLATVNAKIAPILAQLKQIKTIIKTATKIYTTAVSAAKIAKASAFGVKELAVEVIKEAAQRYKADKLQTDGFDFNIGLSKKNEILGTLDPEIEPDNSEIGLHLKFQGAKVKLNSIAELTSVVNIINGKLDDEDAAATRAWVHKIQKTHPLLDDNIEDLTYFKPISNQVGSTYLLHTPDTPTTSLEDWSTDIPLPIRNLLKYKMDETVYDNNTDTYKELNSAMARNISTEYFDERKLQGGQSYLGRKYGVKNVYNNDYHIAGDYTFAIDHIGLVEVALMTALIVYVGGAGKLINWLVEVNNSENALSTGFLIGVEGNNVVVNLKGDKKSVFATVINNTPITVVKE